MEIQAIIFDMDGLMLDTEPLYRTVWKRAAAECGYLVTDEIYRGLVGRGRKVAEQILLQTFGPVFPMEKFRQLSRADEVHAFAFEPVAKKPGLDELLSFVESRNLPKAVATSTERAIALPLLERMGLRDRFVAVATGDEVVRGKPFPDLFLLAAARLGVAPSSCLALEDSEAGVASAAKAGMQVYLVPDLVKPSPEVERLAGGIFDSLADVAKYLEQTLESFKPASTERDA
jgi:HAD superfamily hydrolase (TIGR01509 family)